MNSINIERANGGWIVRAYEYSDTPYHLPNPNSVFTDVESVLAFLKEEMTKEPKKHSHDAKLASVGASSPVSSNAEGAIAKLG